MCVTPAMPLCVLSRLVDGGRSEGASVLCFTKYRVEEDGMNDSCCQFLRIFAPGSLLRSVCDRGNLCRSQEGSIQSIDTARSRLGGEG